MKDWTPKEIKGLRAKHKLSQPALGNLLGVTGNYIYLLEKEAKRPSKTLRLLLDCVERHLPKIDPPGRKRKRKRKGE